MCEFQQCMKLNSVSRLQRSILLPYFGLGALYNPVRGDLVAGLGDITVSEKHLLKQLKHMESCEDGQRLLLTKPVITQESLKKTISASLPPSSLGYIYNEWMNLHKFSPDERTPDRFIQDPNLAYVMTRYRQVHDFWHILCDLPPTVIGELIVKWLVSIELLLLI
jgi:ubiquinone biosynthesis protein COQ4